MRFQIRDSRSVLLPPKTPSASSNNQAGLVESLEKEVKPFGINTLLVEPGYFRTSLLTSNNAFFTASFIEEYKAVTEDAYAAYRAVDGKQPGDPVKGVGRIIDTVKGTGAAEGRETPAQLALGDDAVVDIRKKCEATIQNLKEWESVSTGTNVVE